MSETREFRVKAEVEFVVHVDSGHLNEIREYVTKRVTEVGFDPTAEPYKSNIEDEVVITAIEEIIEGQEEDRGEASVYRSTTTSYEEMT